MSVLVVQTTGSARSSTTIFCLLILILEEEIELRRIFVEPKPLTPYSLMNAAPL